MPPMRPAALSTEREDRAQIAWATPARGDRTFVEILSARITVLLRGSVVRVVLRQEGLSQVVTDFVTSVEIRAWSRGRAPPLNGDGPVARNGRRASRGPG